jgi:hypothetical protein
MQSLIDAKQRRFGKKGPVDIEKPVIRPANALLP